VLVFFDDILIYRKSWEDHVRHVEKVLQLLKEKQLYAKPSICFFGVKEVEYLLSLRRDVTVVLIRKNMITMRLSRHFYNKQKFQKP
jgi:hypothetical protein